MMKKFNAAGPVISGVLHEDQHSTVQKHHRQQCKRARLQQPCPFRLEALAENPFLRISALSLLLCGNHGYFLLERPLEFMD